MRKFVSVFLAVALVAVACCVFASAEDTNLALGKSYTTVGIYTEEGAAAPQYPDEENKSLTDGQKAAAETGYGDAAWVGFNRMDATMQTNGSIGIITVDLGAASSVSGFAIEVFEDSAAGITFPSKVEFFYSTDNETWTSAGEGTKSGEGSVAEFALTLDSAVNASYVKVEMTCGASNWVFVSEFEAFCTAGSGGTDESEAVSEAESETASSAAPAESSTAASSAGTSSTPSTSDAGIVAVVVLAVVAVIGAAVVVKKRA